MHPSILLEVCIDCVESAKAAETGGAHRLEVCGGLAVGGITPSSGLVRRCLEETRLPVMAMVRPHDGGFVYSRDELATMVADIQVMKELGVRGVVFGALTSDRQIDRDACLRLIEAARPLQITFHRAFDVVQEPLAALEELNELGIERVLTSGRAATALEGAPLLRELRRASTATSIIAAAGIASNNVAQLVAATRVSEIHASASVLRNQASQTSCIDFGSTSRVTSSAKVAEILAAVASQPGVGEF